MVPALPTELLEHIFFSIDEADKQTLRAVCATSRLFRRVGTPILYRCVGVSSAALDHEQRSARLHLLCRSLLESPQLVDHVRMLKHCVDVSTVEVLPKDVCDVQELEQLMDPGMDLPVWTQMLTTGESWQKWVSEQSLLTLLMIICRKLVSLEFLDGIEALTEMQFLAEVLEAMHHSSIVDHHRYRQLCSWQSAQPGRPIRSGLHNIRHVRLGHDSAEYLEYKTWARIEVSDIIPLLRLPALQTLHTNALFARSDIQTFVEDLPLINSSLVELTIENCPRDVFDVQELLRSCPALQTLHIEWTMGSLRDLDWQLIGEHLSIWCTRLQHLHLMHGRGTDVDESDLSVTSSEEEDSTLSYLEGDLKRLTLLKTMVVTSLALCPSDEDDRISFGDVFPDTLEELTIVCPSEGLDQEDKDLLQDPFVTTLKAFKVVDRDGTEWVSKDRGEGISTNTNADKGDIWARVEKNLTAQLRKKIQDLDLGRQKEGLPALTDSQVSALMSEFGEIIKRQVNQLPHPSEVIKQIRDGKESSSSSSASVSWSF